MEPNGWSLMGYLTLNHTKYIHECINFIPFHIHVQYIEMFKGCPGGQGRVHIWPVRL